MSKLVKYDEKGELQGNESSWHPIDPKTNLAADQEKDRKTGLPKYKGGKPRGINPPKQGPANHPLLTDAWQTLNIAINDLAHAMPDLTKEHPEIKNSASFKQITKILEKLAEWSREDREYVQRRASSPEFEETDSRWRRQLRGE